MVGFCHVGNLLGNHDNHHYHDNDDRNLNHAVAGAIEALTMARTVSLARHCLSETLS